MQTITFRTTSRQEMFNLTNQVKDIIAAAGVEEGICLISCPHTTAGLVVNSHMDPKTLDDITFELDRLVPTRVDFFHTFDTPSDAAGHVKATLVGSGLQFIVHEGALVLGHSQGILLAEFDGPRDRMVHVKLIAG